MNHKFNLVICCVLMALSTNFAFAQSAQELADLYADLALFQSPMAKELKKGVKKSAIAKMKNEELKATALSLLNKEYNSEFRLASYEAFLNPTTLGQELTIGDGYSKFENMTGIYLPKGKHVVLVDNIAEGRNVNLIISSWHEPASEGWGIYRKYFRLNNGVNIIDLTDIEGLAYLDYYSENPETEKPIEVHFPNAKVNGYFDITRNNNEDWNKLIDNAVYPIIDARGRHIQIAYPTTDCKKYAYGRGTELISNYDSLVYRQHRFLGLIKYNRVPKNHILARVNWKYYMFRDGDGVAYMGTEPGYAMAMVTDPERVIKGDPCWGFSHEVGHVHQLRPYLSWGGLGEVSNNIVTLYVTTSFGNKSRTSQQKNYQSARDSIIAKGICYLQDPDVFNRLVPFWQLQLYFDGVGGNKDFYMDLHEEFRQQGASAAATRENRRGLSRGSRNPAEYQLNFVKSVCKVGKTDLTEFFDKYGFFWVGEMSYNDYGNYTYSMTQEMVDACKAEIKAMNLPKPKVDLTTLED